MRILHYLTARLRRSGALVVENTGNVTEADGGNAASGYSGPPLTPGQRVAAQNTGDAIATGKRSRASTGIDYT